MLKELLNVMNTVTIQLAVILVTVLDLVIVFTVMVSHVKVSRKCIYNIILFIIQTCMAYIQTSMSVLKARLVVLKFAQILTEVTIVLVMSVTA